MLSSPCEDLWSFTYQTLVVLTSTCHVSMLMSINTPLPTRAPLPPGCGAGQCRHPPAAHLQAHPPHPAPAPAQWEKGWVQRWWPGCHWLRGRGSVLGGIQGGAAPPRTQTMAPRANGTRTCGGCDELWICRSVLNARHGAWTSRNGQALPVPVRWGACRFVHWLLVSL